MKPKHGNLATTGHALAFLILLTSAASAQPAAPAAKPDPSAPPTSAAAPKILKLDGTDTDRPIWRATHGVLLDVVRAGDGLIAVGDRGIVLKAGSAGEDWKSPPSGTDALLTSAVFASPAEGWAVGQDATIIHTEDAGVTWKTQHVTPASDRALFSVTQLGPHHLVATGAYALALETTDGTSWTDVKLPAMDEDYHLNCVTARGEDLVITGEAGHAFIRRAGTWSALPVPYQGSQFGCLTLKDGTVLSFGLRGSLFSLAPDANSWKRLETGEQRAIFGGALLGDGHIALVGSNGLAMDYDLAAAHGRTLPPPTGATLSGVTETAGGKWAVVGEDGVFVVDPAAPQTGSAVQ